jgi:NAD(P)-dependent dehydrogenase (short-subunit alcohol dehydrogenase family)
MDLGLMSKVALVTGSSSGIGRATALLLGAEGVRVAVTYHTRRDAAERVVAEVTASGGEALAVHYDMDDEQSIRTAVSTVCDRWGAVDILVNNAFPRPSYWPRNGESRFEELPPELWRTLIRCTIEGVFHTIQQVLPSMRTRGWGRIVTVSSILAEAKLGRIVLDTGTVIGFVPYAAAKAALHGMTRALAWELGPVGILANVVVPGFTTTERMTAVMPDEVRNLMAQHAASGRLSTVDDVAVTIGFLASAANGNITGEIVTVDGRV